MANLASWLNEETIQYADKVTSWQEAIILAGRPLLAAGAISPRYIDAIISMKQEIGAYFVIAPRIAMPHARPEQGANKLGLSVLKLASAINFDAGENDPVDIIFMFSAPDSNSHIDMISQLAEVLSDDDTMQHIFTTRSKAALMALLLPENHAG
ncbi:PTS mannitol transporter subunit IIA [Erwinia sp. OLTSP20]|uniref:PTS sugar transporter subunit IIA n=1 Tax=unclassified Erwinia TaxID=2622719 RepID=UPI000C190CF2|nr:MULTISPECIES: PTS sugar transporter subunit IIA [unclassified Erwinia]PIJ50395.1 PTS mannitol transporter subunit IIA [Erwinia sp. OAMSP11]PIJ71654.1 PTS mannitol transporter subunit IIA [Erwinia sp. OLSSP12]PIJ81038.1 PTS mannitol transporter subunit IIA [Erwinia sp. OLCASP19]PIJ83296.1 PTS mannitol transporter subunit IIA [Erwinia sp. OLMTSP26]PIJ85976.1 PTS mannitol transporter subunit IIA [Erwinia sp. OLMDSP33]